MTFKLYGVENVRSNINKFSVERRSAFQDAFQRWATEAQNRSKDNAPWTDRTGNARNSIYGVAPGNEDKIRAYHGIGVYYGVFLELANNGKYRIIWPTMEALKGKLNTLVKKI